MQHLIHKSLNYTKKFYDLKRMATPEEVKEFYLLQPIVLQEHLYFEAVNGAASPAYLCFKNTKIEGFSLTERVFQVNRQAIYNFQLRKLIPPNNAVSYYQLIEPLEKASINLCLVSEEGRIPSVEKVYSTFRDYPKKDEEGRPVFIRKPFQLMNSHILRIRKGLYGSLPCVEDMVPGCYVGVYVTPYSLLMPPFAHVYSTEQECRMACISWNRFFGYSDQQVDIILANAIKNEDAFN